MTEAAIQRVRSLVDLDRHHEARAALAPLLAGSPNDAELHGLEAQALLGLEDGAGALAAGNRVVALEPDQAWGHQICALALLRLDNATAATHAAAQAVRLAPNHWNAHRIYAFSAAGVPGRGPDALAAAQRAVQLAPHEPDAHFALGVVAEQQRRHDLAMACYREALALDANHAGALTRLTGLTHGHRISRAARGYASALREAPDSTTALANLDRLAFRFLRHLYWPAVGALLIALLVAQAGGAVAPVSGFTVGLGLTVMLGTAAYVLVLGRDIPSGVRRHSFARIRRVPLLLATACLSAAMLITLTAVCLVPGAGDLVLELGLVRWLGLANVALVVWGITWMAQGD